MKILFIHQNFPGQYLHLSKALADRGHECRVLTDAANKAQIALPTWRYRFEAQRIDPNATRLGRNYTMMSDRGTVVARAAQALRQQGYIPDVILGHSGWGETLFLKEIWPEAKLLIFSEFYYRGRGADTGFDPEFGSSGFDQLLVAQARSSYLCQALVHADRGIAPTHWQASTLPPLLRQSVDVLFDGVDCDQAKPDPSAHFKLGDGRILRAGDEVLTFVNRNLEPYRGYHIFMRALPALMAARPEAQVVIVGGDQVSYGPAPAGKSGWKDIFLTEVADRIDRSRLHFMGKVPYRDFLSLMQVSRVHAYLTYPFVLSWSMIEAMAAGCLVVGSKTAPVQEVITEGENGLLVDFFDVDGWSRTLTEALASPDRYEGIRQAARQSVLEKYDLKSICLPAQIAWVETHGQKGAQAEG